MTAQYQLTGGFIRAICQGAYENQPEFREPTVQILNVKQMNPAPNQPQHSKRFRVIVSDGQNFTYGMLATQLNPMVADNQLGKDTVVRCRQYAVNVVQGRRLLILTQADVLGQAPDRIGNPVAVTEDSKAASAGGNQSSYQAPAAAKPMQSNPHTNPMSSAVPSQLDGAVFPIKSLNPYQNKWTIKARVVNKSDVRTWSNAKGEGKLFSVTLLDDSGEIKATGFNDSVDKLYPLLEEDKVYYISKAAIKMARKQYSNVQNDYEISFDNNTQIVPCHDVSSIPKQRYTFVPINQMNDYPKDAIVDVIAVVKEVGELQSLTSKTTQRQMTKRDLVLVDQSNSSIKATLWGNQAETFDGNAQPVVAFKGLRVSDYGGRTLSTSNGTSVSVNPDIPEAHVLRGWYDSIGNSTEMFSLSAAPSGSRGGTGDEQRKVLDQIEKELLGQGDKPDYITVDACIVYIKSEGNIWYTACPGENCSKKVTNEGPNVWRCEKCQRTYNRCDYRYLLSINVSDNSGAAWLSCFNETAELILGHKAEELNQLRENDNTQAYQAAFQDANFADYVFKIRVKQEHYNDEMKVRCQVVAADRLDYVQESQRLLRLLGQ